MYTTLMFCQFFLRSDARKLHASFTFALTAALSIWNLMVAMMVLAFSVMSSEEVSSVGNLPALFRPGPRRRGIFLMSVSDDRKASYCAANFFTIFLFLLNFLRSSSVL